MSRHFEFGHGADGSKCGPPNRPAGCRGRLSVSRVRRSPRNRPAAPGAFALAGCAEPRRNRQQGPLGSFGKGGDDAVPTLTPSDVRPVGRPHRTHRPHMSALQRLPPPSRLQLIPSEELPCRCTSTG
jgi:hypothetical protein